MVFEAHDYRTVLKTALATPGPQRRRVSLRAFSRRLGVSPSYLSEVMNAKKALSVELALKIAVKLNLTETESQYFCLLVQRDQEKDIRFREELARRLETLNPRRKAHDLSVDLFRSISEWYHGAILELTYLPGVNLDAAYAARMLGIEKVEADLAIERLVRLGLLESGPHGLVKTHAQVGVESKIPSEAIRSFHNQILTKASKALETQNADVRLSATDLMPIDSTKLDKIDRLAREFSAQVLKISQESTVRDSVYALAVHFFKLTNDQGKNK